MYQDTLNLPEIIENLHISVLFMSIGIFLFGLASLILVWAFDTRKPGSAFKTKLVAGLLSLAFAGLCVIFANNTSEERRNSVLENAEARKQSVAKLEDNIKVKYEFDEIKMTDQLLQVHSMKDHEPSFGVPEEYDDDLGFIVNVTVGDRTFAYVLTQDPETFEPTLSDPPAPVVRGGDATENAPTANDLLKESD